MFFYASKSTVRSTVRKASETRPNWESERSEAKRPKYRPNHPPFRGEFGRFGHAFVWRPIRRPKCKADRMGKTHRQTRNHRASTGTGGGRRLGSGRRPSDAIHTRFLIE
jgi:hypothetical protein